MAGLSTVERQLLVVLEEQCRDFDDVYPDQAGRYDRSAELWHTLLVNGKHKVLSEEERQLLNHIQCISIEFDLYFPKENGRMCCAAAAWERVLCDPHYSMAALQQRRYYRIQAASHARNARCHHHRKRKPTADEETETEMATKRVLFVALSI
jgi:hypothetical protein